MQPRTKRILMALALLMVAGLIGVSLLRPQSTDPRLVGTWASLPDFDSPSAGGYQPFILLADGTWKDGVREIVDMEIHGDQMWRVQGETLLLMLRPRSGSAWTRFGERLTDLIQRRDSALKVLEFQLKPTPEGGLELLETSRWPVVDISTGDLTVAPPPLRLVRWEPVNTASSE